MPRYIYKLLRDNEWQTAKRLHFFEGAPVDLMDGYLHFSTAGQVAETALRYFARETPLHMLAVDPWMLPVGQLRWEAARGGESFPHLYGPLPMTALAYHHILFPGKDGRHDFSALLELEHHA